MDCKDYPLILAAAAAASLIQGFYAYYSGDYLWSAAFAWVSGLSAGAAWIIDCD